MLHIICIDLLSFFLDILVRIYSSLFILIQFDLIFFGTVRTRKLWNFKLKLLLKTINYYLKGAVSLISSEPPHNGNARFTTVPIKPFSDKI